LLVEGLTLHQGSLRHLKLLLRHCLLVAEGQNGSAVGSLGRDSSGKLATQSVVGSLKVGNAVLVVGNCSLALLFLVLQRRLKAVDYLHVFLNLTAQCCRRISATAVTNRAGGTSKNVDVDVFGSR